MKSRRARIAVLVLAAAVLLGGGAIAHAQSVTIDLGDGQSFSLRTVQLFLLITVLIGITCLILVAVFFILRRRSKPSGQNRVIALEIG